MQKRINFGVNEEIIVSNEKIKGFLLDINSLQNDGLTLSVINDLNKVSIDVTIFRANGKETQIIKGWLDDVLHALYEGSEIYKKVVTASGLGYTIPVDFGNTLNLGKKDRMVIRITAQNTSFTSLNLGNSSINVETIPSTSNAEGGLIAKVSTTSIGNGETGIDKELPENTYKVVLALDFTAGYSASAKSKITDVTIKDSSTILKKVSENLLFSENVLMNLHSVPNMLVAYSGGLIQNGRIESQLTIPADTYAKVLMLSAVRP